MRRDSRAVHPFRRLIHVLLLAALVFGVGQVAAQTPPGSLVATSVTGLSRGPAGVSGLLNAVLIETERRAYYSVPATVGWGTLGAAAKAGMRGVVRLSPYVGLAMTAAELAGWQPNGDWFDKGDGVPSRDLANGTTYVCALPQNFDIPAQYCVETSNAQQLATWLIGKKGSGIDAGCTVTQADVPNGQQVRFYCYMPNGTLKRYGYTSPVYTTEPASYRTPEYRQATLVTEQEMAEAIAANPSNLHAMLHDTAGKPHQYPEIQAALNSLANSIGQQTGNQPQVEGEEVEPGSEEPGGPEPQPDPNGSELPAFCEWAKVVCDFIDWYKKPPEETQPVKPEWDEDVADMEDYTTGLADDGACPSPETVNVWGTDLEFSYQPVCDLAVMLRPVIILGGLILSAFILAGLRNNNV